MKDNYELNASDTYRRQRAHLMIPETTEIGRGGDVMILPRAVTLAYNEAHEKVMRAIRLDMLTVDQGVILLRRSYRNIWLDLVKKMRQADNDRRAAARKRTAEAKARAAAMAAVQEAAA